MRTITVYKVSELPKALLRTTNFILPFQNSAIGHFNVEKVLKAALVRFYRYQTEYIRREGPAFDCEDREDLIIHSQKNGFVVYEIYLDGAVEDVAAIRDFIAKNPGVTEFCVEAD